MVSKDNSFTGPSLYFIHLELDAAKSLFHWIYVLFNSFSANKETSISSVAEEQVPHKPYTYENMARSSNPTTRLCLQVPYDLASMIPRVNNQLHILEIPPCHPSSIYCNVYTKIQSSQQNRIYHFENLLPCSRFSPSSVSSWTLGPIQPPIQWVPGVKWQGCEVDHSPPFNAEVMKVGAIPPLPHVFTA
jgi:hypothetical protein